MTEEQLDQLMPASQSCGARRCACRRELAELEKEGCAAGTMENIARVIEMWTKIPASKIKEEEFKRLAELDVRLKQHIVGRTRPWTPCRRPSGARHLPKHKPVSFIFVGSTGVGKTELVSAWQTICSDSPDSLIRLDMSEFMEKHSVSPAGGLASGLCGL